MSIVNRRNAVIGFLALQALKRARRNAAVGYLAAQGMEHTRARRSNRRALKITFYVLLGLVSLGILAALAGLAKSRRSGSAPPEAAAGDVPAATGAAADEIAPATEPAVAT